MKNTISKKAYLIIDNDNDSEEAVAMLKELGYELKVSSSITSFLTFINDELDEDAYRKPSTINCNDIIEAFATLTNREKQVVEHLVFGEGESSNKAIAKSMNISHRTVEEHRASAMRKMNAKSLKEVITMVINCNLFEANAI